MRLRRSLFLALVLAAGPSPSIAAPRHGSIVLATAQGQTQFSIEIVSTEEDRETGLMFRRSLARDAGMLFVYPADQEIDIWMKNTFIPLDVLFIRADGTIGAIRQRAVPQSLEIIPSGEPVRAALELNGGTVSRLGIAVGDRITGEGFPIVDAAPTPPPPPPKATGPH